MDNTEVCVYTAFKTECHQDRRLNGHITTSFTVVQGKMPKIFTRPASYPRELAMVVAVEYWAKPDVTVALVESRHLLDRHIDLLEVGLSYEHEFRPHITLTRGDALTEYAGCVGVQVCLGDEYVGLITRVVPA